MTAPKTAWLAKNLLTQYADATEAKKYPELFVEMVEKSAYDSLVEGGATPTATLASVSPTAREVELEQEVITLKAELSAAETSNKELAETILTLQGELAESHSKDGATEADEEPKEEEKKEPSESNHGEG